MRPRRHLEEVALDIICDNGKVDSMGTDPVR